MTTAIAQFMRELERVWDGHREALLGRRDLEASLASLTAEPSVLHIPAMTGTVGGQAVRRFYREDFLPHLPGDLAVVRISRTVDRFRLVDEGTVSFTHDRELPWLLPGIGPTYRRAEVLAITVVAFERQRIRSQRVLWDYATLTAQLDVPASPRGPRLGRPGRLPPAPPAHTARVPQSGMAWLWQPAPKSGAARWRPGSVGDCGA